MKLSSLSVFFPCYNEAENIPLIIADCVRELPKLAKKFEVIIVNDGSSDQTVKVVSKLLLRYKFLRLVSHPQNLGYGAALRTGIAAARYQWIFWTDADRQFDLAQLNQFVSATKNYQVIIGYRLRRAEGWRRDLFTKIYTRLMNLAFGMQIKDIDCAFKLIAASCLKPLSIYTFGALTSAEILYRLTEADRQILQLPVNHLPRKLGQPTGNHPKVILRAIKEFAWLSQQLTRERRG